MSEIDSGIRFKQSGNIVKIAGDDDPALCDINAKVGGSIIGVKTVKVDNVLASDARVKIGGVIKALKLGFTYIPVSTTSNYDKVVNSWDGHSGTQPTIAEAWNQTLLNWNNASWSATGIKDVRFWNAIWTSGAEYRGNIVGQKAKLTVDLTAYDPADYEVAYLVVKPIKAFTTYYNEQGWIENDFNYIADMLLELGTVWTSVAEYNLTYTPLQPTVDLAHGYIASFYIALIHNSPV